MHACRRRQRWELDWTSIPSANVPNDSVDTVDNAGIERPLSVENYLLAVVSERSDFYDLHRLDYCIGVGETRAK